MESNEDKDNEAELTAAARELLQGDEEMQNVHSNKSVTALMKAARDKIVDERGKGVAKESFASGEVMTTQFTLTLYLLGNRVFCCAAVNCCS
jgi:hypothetical protein